MPINQGRVRCFRPSPLDLAGPPDCVGNQVDSPQFISEVTQGMTESSSSVPSQKTAVTHTAEADQLTDALSVDVEDYFHVEAFAENVSREKWPSFPSRVHANCERILEIFEKHGWRATFFVLGWVAEREPALVRKIANAGHELACHSYAHRRVFSLSAEEFRD